MPDLYDVAALGNAIVDVIAPASDAFLDGEGLTKGSMSLIDEQTGEALYGRMAAGVEASGGSAGNTVSGLAGFGGRAAFIGKVGEDQLGQVFAHDMRAQGVRFDSAPLPGLATGRCLINVTPDGQRTMSTCLGAATYLSPADVEPDLIQAARIVYLEGYLFDPADARAAFGKAAALARQANRLIALTLSDAFVVDRHRQALLDFIASDVDLLFANEAEITSLFQCGFDEACAAVGARVKVAAVTRSEQGSVVVAGGSGLGVAAEPVEKVVDTTGAGDQYAAGFLFGLSSGRSLEACARLGSLAAAEVISHYGPRPLVSLSDLARAKGL